MNTVTNTFWLFFDSVIELAETFPIAWGVVGLAVAGLAWAMAVSQ